MKVEDYTERKVQVAGWECNLTTYRVDNVYHCKADNVSPGAALCRTTGATREEAEEKALARAAELLSRTKRHSAD